MARLAFGDCILDSESRVLERAGRAVHLTPKAFELLELLLAERPRAMSKAKLMDALWPGIAVTEGSLANLVSEVRIATGDLARSARFLRTVHRFGYAFSGEAREEDLRGKAALEPPARFRLLAPDGEADLDEGDNIIGRGEDCRLRIQSGTVSRHHARVRVRGDQVVLEDLGSKNGTFVSGLKVVAPTTLSGGEEIRVGSIIVRFSIFSAFSSTDTFSLRTKAAPR
ncbi:MAG TPA: FHA domain-containing protein [Vicinamibacteria bacterium]|nr:FHA domain-containing protein [Vicinamibacteria bacterium]